MSALSAGLEQPGTGAPAPGRSDYFSFKEGAVIRDAFEIKFRAAVAEDATEEKGSIRIRNGQAPEALDEDFLQNRYAASPLKSLSLGTLLSKR